MNRGAQPTVTEDEHVVAELYRLGVRHLARFDTQTAPAAIAPAQLMAALAAHPQARLQGALILLFLRRPDYQQYIFAALEGLDPYGARSLKLFYQAAVYLQRELNPILQSNLERCPMLADLFSAEQGLPPATTVQPGPLTAQPALEVVGEQHRQHSGRGYNWAGSYRQHIPLFLKHLETRDP